MKNIYIYNACIHIFIFYIPSLPKWYRVYFTPNVSSTTTSTTQTRHSDQIKCRRRNEQPTQTEIPKVKRWTANRPGLWKDMHNAFTARAHNHTTSGAKRPHHTTNPWIPRTGVVVDRHVILKVLHAVLPTLGVPVILIQVLSDKCDPFPDTKTSYTTSMSRFNRRNSTTRSRRERYCGSELRCFLQGCGTSKTNESGNTCAKQNSTENQTTTERSRNTWDDSAVIAI